MPQIFHRSFNLISRATIVGTLLLVGGAAFAAVKVIRSPYYTGAFQSVEQPVPFSHRHHVAGLKIDCRYCHTAVEESASAGMPSTKTCMNCHSQIWAGSSMLAPVRESYDTVGTDALKPIQWTRVHKVPDFVKFNHSIHVNKGIGCVSCHGRVDQMPLAWQVNTLFMSWCLDCHRNPEKHIRPREEVFNLAWERPDGFDPHKYIQEYNVQSKTYCSACHR